MSHMVEAFRGRILNRRSMNLMLVYIIPASGNTPDPLIIGGLPYQWHNHSGRYFRLSRVDLSPHLSGYPSTS